MGTLHRELVVSNRGSVGELSQHFPGETGKKLRTSAR